MSADPRRKPTVATILTGAGLLGLLALPGDAARASGYQLRENSALGLGMAFAGSVSSADDIATVFNNPAGMTLQQGFRVGAVGSLVSPSARFSATTPATYASGTAIRGGDGGEIGRDRFVPAFYVLAPVGEDARIGVAVTVPFALVSAYDDGWVGRYHGRGSEVKTLNLNPNLAWRVAPGLSVGGGVSFQRATAALGSAVDFAAVAGLPALSGSLDGSADARGSDTWGVGWNLGVMWQPLDGTRIGLAYRWRIHHTLSGQASFTVPAALRSTFAARGIFVDTGVKASFETPGFGTASITQELSPALSVSADVGVTRWSKFRELRLRYSNPLQPDSVVPENWHDTVFVALGTSYRWSDRLTLRSGVAYDQSPVPDTTRTVRIPDQDRYWLAAGASYRVSDALRLDAGYAHLFIRDASLNQSIASAGTVIGTYRGSSVDLFSVAATFAF